MEKHDFFRLFIIFFIINSIFFINMHSSTFFKRIYETGKEKAQHFFDWARGKSDSEEATNKSLENKKIKKKIKKSSNEIKKEKEELISEKIENIEEKTDIPENSKELSKERTITDIPIEKKDQIKNTFKEILFDRKKNKTQKKKEIKKYITNFLNSQAEDKNINDDTSIQSSETQNEIIIKKEDLKNFIKETLKELSLEKKKKNNRSVGSKKKLFFNLMQKNTEESVSLKEEENTIPSEPVRETYKNNEPAEATRQAEEKKYNEEKNSIIEGILIPEKKFTSRKVKKKNFEKNKISNDTLDRPLFSESENKEIYTTEKKLSENQKNGTVEKDQPLIRPLILTEQEI